MSETAASWMERESLDRYVRRVLYEEGLTLSDVECRSEGEISDSYVSAIASGKIKNVTLEKLKALARGLGVTEAHLLSVACGISFPYGADLLESELALLFSKYKELPEQDRNELTTILEMLNDEIERRIGRLSRKRG
jgi:transcriptional regulator with XRE-family HTH domain